MNSSRKRSASAAFGSSEDMPLCVNEKAEHDSTVNVDPDNDVQPTTRIISKIQAVELLEEIIQFVPKEFSKDSAVASPCAAKNVEIEEIKISSQFKLRYLCRRFRNIVHNRTTANLHFNGYLNGPFSSSSLHITDSLGVSLSRTREHYHIADSISCLVKIASGQMVGALADNISGIRLHVSGLQPEPSDLLPVDAVLTSATSILPRKLSLHLDVDSTPSIDATKSLVKDFDTSLIQQFPDVSLHKLSYNYCVNAATDDASVIAVQPPHLKYFLDFGKTSLIELSANIFTLSTALPESDWVCASLRSLKLNVCAVEADYDYSDDDSRTETYGIYSKLRRCFSNLEKISISGGCPQVDFSVLNQFSRLKAVKLTSKAETSQSERNLNLVPLAGVKSFSLHNDNPLPSPFSAVFPNLQKFKFMPNYAEAFADLRMEIDDVADSFAQLTHLVVKPGIAFYNFPTYAEFVLLLCAMSRRDRLASLTLDLGKLFPADWCPAGDFQILSALPPKLTNVSLVSVLRPQAVAYQSNTNQWALSYMNRVPFVKEAIYQDWVRTLLCHVIKHPSLVYFYCLCIAPSFEAIYALAERWNKSSAKAIADLGLHFVVHVQCTPVYARMTETRIPTPGDRFRFRFVLAPRQESADAEEGSTKATEKKIVTVEFENPRAF